MARKRAGGGSQGGRQKKGSGGKKKAVSGQSQGSEEWIDMGYELRKAYAQSKQNRARIEADETFASGARRGRGQAPGRTDGRRYG